MKFRGDGGGGSLDGGNKHLNSPSNANIISHVLGGQAWTVVSTRMDKTTDLYIHLYKINTACEDQLGRYPLCMSEGECGL